MNYIENIEFLNTQLNQTQLWLENEKIEKDPYVVTMIIKGMIETEKQIDYFRDLIMKQ